MSSRNRSSSSSSNRGESAADSETGHLAQPFHEIHLEREVPGPHSRHHSRRRTISHSNGGQRHLEVAVAVAVESLLLSKGTRMSLAHVYGSRIPEAVHLLYTEEIIHSPR